ATHLSGAAATSPEVAAIGLFPTKAVVGIERTNHEAARVRTNIDITDARFHLPLISLGGRDRCERRRNEKPSCNPYRLAHRCTPWANRPIEKRKERTPSPNFPVLKERESQRLFSATCFLRPAITKGGNLRNLTCDFSCAKNRRCTRLEDGPKS